MPVGDKTIAVNAAIEELMSDGNPNDTVEYLRELNGDFATFDQSLEDVLLSRLENHQIPEIPGLSVDPNSLKNNRNEQKRLLDEIARNRNIAVINRNTLQRWLNGAVSPEINQGTQSTRNNLYAICAIMNCDYKDTLDFFRRVAFTRPFNLKVYQEAIWFWYCEIIENKDQWYQKGLDLAKAIEKKAAAITGVDMTLTITKTENVEYELSLNETEEELKDFILKNWATFYDTNNGITAKEKICKLFEQCKVAAAFDNFIFQIPGVLSEERSNQGYDILCYPTFDPTPELDVSIDTVFNIIFGSQIRGGAGGDNLITAPRELHSAIVTNFPTGTIMREILNSSKSVSHDRLRKMLVLLSFYKFYIDSWVNKEWLEDDKRKKPALYGNYDFSQQFNEFVAHVNLLLYKCGFDKLYSRNPYDCVFLACARDAHPLDFLRRLIAEVFEKDPLIREEI